MSNFVSVKTVSDKARIQLECFKTHPELAKGMPISPDALALAFDEVAAAQAAQERLKKSLLLMTQAVQRTLFVLREKLRANLAIAALLHGHASEAITLLGGKPRGGGRVKRKGTEEGPAGPAGPVS